MPAGRPSHKRLRGQAAWWGEQKIQDTNLAPELVSVEVTQTADGLSSAKMGLELVVDGYPARAFSLQARRFRGYVAAMSFGVDMCSRVVEGGPCAGLLQLSTPSSLSSNKRCIYVGRKSMRLLSISGCSV